MARSDNNLSDSKDVEGSDENGCTRCGTELTYLGLRAFYESKGFAVNTYFGDFFAKKQLRVFYCSACGHVDLFLKF